MRTSHARSICESFCVFLLANYPLQHPASALTESEDPGCGCLSAGQDAPGAESLPAGSTSTTTTSGQNNFDKRPHRTEGGFFAGEKLMRHRSVRSNAVGCGSAADAVLIFCCVHQYTAAVTRDAFHCRGRGATGSRGQLTPTFSSTRSTCGV